MAEQPNKTAYEAGIEAETYALFRAAHPNASECSTPKMSYWREKVLQNRAAVEGVQAEIKA